VALQDQNTSVPIPAGSMPPTETQQVQARPVIKRGQWLRNRLNSLYSDPVYSKASPEVQKYYKDRAYDKWVVPYYKHIGEKPISKDTFIGGGQDPAVRDRIAIETLANKSDKEELTILKTSSKFLSGVSNILNFAASFDPTLLPSERKNIHEMLSTSENYYDKQAQDLEDRIQDKGGHDLATKVTALGTQAIFFEASGGNAAASALRITNPMFVKTVTPTVKTLWNGAVTGTLWGATTGSKAKELPSDAATFALMDLGLTKASSVFFKVFGKFIERSKVVQTVQEAAEDLVAGKGVIRPKVEDFVKAQEPTEQIPGLIVGKRPDRFSPINVNEQASKVAVAKALNESAQKVAGGDTNGAFKRLSPKEQKALLMRLTMVTKQSSESTLDSIFSGAMLKDAEEQMKTVVPAAAKIQGEIDQVIKSHGVDPTEAKLATKLPRHQTTIDSPISHISARMSFLRNQLKAADKKDLIMSEVDTLREALRQEQDLYKQVKARSQQSTAHGSGGISPEEAKRPGQHYVVSKGGTTVTRHGKEFDPGGITQGSTHVTVLPDGSIRTNEGILTKTQEKALRKTLAELYKEAEKQ